MTIETLDKARLLQITISQADRAIRLLKLDPPDREDLRLLGDAMFELNKISGVFPPIIREIKDQAESEFNLL